MKDTIKGENRWQDSIKAKRVYIVKRVNVKIGGRELRALYDGDEFIMMAYAMSREELFASMKDNEYYFHACEVFTARTGKQFVYARDEKLDTDYLINL